MTCSRRRPTVDHHCNGLALPVIIYKRKFITIILMQVVITLQSNNSIILNREIGLILLI